MSWRTIVISSRAKLDYKMNYLEVRGYETVKVHLSEIGTLIIANTAVSLTAYLLCELTKQKIKVIFCDEKRNPSSELISYYGSHDTSAKIKNQVAWKQETKDLVWTEIVRNKIENQRNLLLKYDKEESIIRLDHYLDELQIGDGSNREAHSAKVYFNALFGLGFNRREENSINAALNYGYSILLSTFNREIVSCGYITQLGISHTNQFNHFNLSSDLMEPFRSLVDEVVVNMKPEIFEKDQKLELIGLLQKEIKLDGRTHLLDYAIKLYTKSVLDALDNDDVNLLRFYKDEL